MKKHIIYIFILFLSSLTFAQVGINTEAPNEKSLLEIVSSDKGVLIPRMTESERDAIITNGSGNTAENSLLIYNTDEDCYNYWNRSENEWSSLCGKMGKAEFTVTDCSAITVSGQYLDGTSLTSGNYITVPVNVTKPGAYTISAVTNPDNGYYFTTSGEFLSTGTYNIQIPGMGAPTNFQTDEFTISLNGVEANGTDPACIFDITVEDSSVKPLYKMECGSVTVNGVYKIDTPLTAANTIQVTLTVDPSALGATYNISTNSVDGISFSGTGLLSSTNQVVTLYGTGTPTSITTKIMTISSNSQSTAATCNANVIVVIPTKSIVHLGGTGDHGYSAFEDASRNLLNEPANFGTTATSIVKAEGFTHTRPVGASNIVTALNAKPDIVITGYPYTPSASEITALVSYMNAGGVVIAHLEGAASIQNFMRSIFGDAAITATGRNGGGAVYSIVNYNDEILNGPFGDVRGKNWGEDASPTVAVTNLPASMITAYSSASAINSTNTYTGSTMFKHNSLNLFYVGDAGFLSNFNANGTTTSNTAYPFATTVNNFPIEKAAYGGAGNGYSAGSMQVQNSIIFANALAWAIKQAQFNGINTP